MTNTTEKYLNKNLFKKSSFVKPVFLKLSKPGDQERCKKLFLKQEINHIIDDYEEQQLELFSIKNPTLVYKPFFRAEFKKYYKKLQARKPSWTQGTWVFFPWTSTLVHILDKNDFQIVRTARNKNLIKESEQKKFYNATIGIAGLSVGSSVAYAITLQGGGKHFKLADMDRLALSNTNRILSGVNNLGILKVEMAAKKIYEINPYAHIELFPKGIQKNNIKKFFTGLDIIIDEIDNLGVKYLIREEARKNKIAVVMAADNGDNAVIDIERHDLNQNIPFFHDRMGNVSYNTLNGLDKFGIGRMITKLVGPENVTERMQQSLLEIGKTIVSWPQLGGAAMVNGAAVAYCVRKILNNQPLEKNRSLISLDEKFIPGFNSKLKIRKRNKISKKFSGIFGL